MNSPQPIVFRSVPPPSSGGVFPRDPNPRRRPTGLALRMPPAILLLALASCTIGVEQETGEELEAVQADEIAYGVEHRMTREGVHYSTLVADSLFLWRDSSHARVMGLTLIVFDERGRRRATINADTGRLSQVTEELTATGNAILTVIATGQEIRTEELNFSQDEDRVWSDLPVVMREAGCVVEGDRFQADMAFDDLRIWGTREGACANR